MKGLAPSPEPGARGGRVQEPRPGFSEKYFSNLPVSRSKASASAGGSPLTVMFGQTLRVFGVDPQPLAVRIVFGVGLDGVDRALRLADAAVDAFVRIDRQEVLALVEAVDRAHLDAVHELTFDAGIGDDVGHGALGTPARPESGARFFTAQRPLVNAAPMQSLSAERQVAASVASAAQGSSRGPRLGGRAAAFAHGLDAHGDQPAAEGEDQLVADLHGARGLVEAGLLAAAGQAHAALLDELGGQRAGLEEARAPEPDVGAAGVGFATASLTRRALRRAGGAARRARGGP